MINKESFREHFSFFDKEIVVEIINIFEDEYTGRIESITQHLQDHDYTNLRKAAHAFKGVISNFEMEGESYRLIKKIETEAHRLEDEINEGRVISEKEMSEIFIFLESTFLAFKPASFQLLQELKEIKKEYIV